MTTKHGAELTLEKIAGKQGEYKLIPSRQADECPFGAEYGWKVKHIMQEGENFLAIRKPNGDVVWTMKLTKLNEQECEEMQQMMEQEEPWNAVNSVLLNRAYLRDMVCSTEPTCVIWSRQSRNCACCAIRFWPITATVSSRRICRSISVR